jgi:hypothetical protein
MIHPSDLSSTNYSSLFEISIKSAVDRSITKSSFISPTNTKSRLLEDSWEEEIEKSQFDFGWTVVVHNSTVLKIQLEMENPKSLSTSPYGRDEVIIKFLDFSYFTSAESQIKMDSSAFKVSSPQ